MMIFCKSTKDVNESMGIDFLLIGIISDIIILFKGRCVETEKLRFGLLGVGKVVEERKEVCDNTVY